MTESTEARYLAGLRERQLFALAESYCRRRLAEAYVSERRRSELTVELSRTSLEAALYAKSPERDALFAQAVKYLDDEVRHKPSTSWQPVFAVQSGLVDLVWGERLREESQTLSAGAAASEQARDRLRSAVVKLKQARSAIDERLVRRETRAGELTKPETPTAAELGSLKRNVDYQLARAYRNQGESYPPGSADRLSALDQAVESLEQLSRSETTDAVAWQARLDEAACKRLLGDLAGSERLLDLIDGQAPPAEIADRARAQRIRNRLAAAKLDEAQKFFRTEDAEPAANVDPEVRLAGLEWLIAQARAAEEKNAKNDAADLQARAAAMAKLIDERHSPYWARRAETLLATSAASSSTPHDDTVLGKAAESFFRQGNVDRALEIYDQISAQALSKQNPDAAFSAGFTAAAIEQQRGRYAFAAERYLKLVAVLPQHARAPEAQLLAAFNLAQSLASLSEPAAVQAGLARYVELLEQQVKRWPSDKPTAQARVWLARVYAQRKQWDLVVTALRGVPADDPSATEAVGEMGRAAGTALRELRAGGKSPAAALGGYEQALLSFAPRSGERQLELYPPAARQALRLAVALRLEFADDRFAESAATLQKLLQAPDRSTAEEPALRLALVLAEAGSGRLDAAQVQAEQLSGVPAPDAGLIVERLDQLSVRAKPEERATWAKLVLRIIDFLRPHRDTIAEWIQRVAPAEARAFAQQGRVAEARKVWDALAAQRPRDAEIQEGYAEFLSSLADRESLTAAAGKWREVESAARESTPAWYRARLGLAQTYLKLGDSARARQLIDLTQALHPDLGGAEMKRRFDELPGRRGR